jgi:AraC-like DNA-binding protein
MGTPAKPSEPDFFSLQVQDSRRFYLDLAPPATQPTAVVCGGCERCGPDYAIHRDSFAYYSIEFVARGKGRLMLGGRPVPLVPGTVFSYGPGVAQDITTDAVEPLVKYFVDFTGSRALALLKEHGLGPGSVGHLSAPVEVQGVFDELIRNGLKGTRFSPLLCVALLEQLILQVAECLIPGATAQTPAFATYQRCRAYIQEHATRLRTLGQIARQCHIDAAYLCRLFRRYDNQTPYQFLLRLKMNLAAQRLQQPAVLVKQVAAEFGFADPFHFSRAFKSVFGLSPEAFRRPR